MNPLFTSVNTGFPDDQLAKFYILTPSSFICLPVYLPFYRSSQLMYRSKLQLRTGHGTTDWFEIGKGVCQGCILSPCLFNLYAEYIMRNTGLEEAQAGIKIAGKI